jgi:multimeric flavodoxin WrbA
MDRRSFLTKGITAGSLITTGQIAHAESNSDKKIKIVGISCSTRKGKTTSTGVKTALQAAAKFDNRLETELIDLGGMKIAGWTGGAKPGSEEKIIDDFYTSVEPVLRDDNIGGLIIGSPVYFRSMSSICKAFLERLSVLRSPSLLLANKPVGVLAVGAYRNGGQELVIEQIQTAMLCHEVMVVGAKPRAHQGATLWNAYNDDITKDEFGIDTAKKLGIRVAEAALRLKDF